MRRLRRPTARSRATCAGVALALLGLAACTSTPPATALLVTTTVARAAVNLHWDVNRQALRATSATQARQLIERVEGGDALKMDEEVIAREADARAIDHSSPPTIPDSKNVRVFVPRQSSYPMRFVSIRTQPLTDRAGALTGKSDEVLELFQQAAAGAPWRNMAYADVAPAALDKLDIAVDREGYAQFANGPPGESQLSSLYSGYLNAVLAGHPEQASKRVIPGPLTDQFADQVRKDLARVPTIKRAATFTASVGQDGIKLRTRSGEVFVLFSNRYDLVTTATDGGCVTAGPGSSLPGAHVSVTEHYLQGVGAVVAAGTDGAVAVVAESDSVVGVDSRPCNGGATI